MKKIVSLIIAAAVLAATAFSAGALTAPGYPGVQLANDWDDQLTVTGYTGDDPVVRIPETAYDKVVKRIDQKAFYNNQIVEKLIMHDNMTQVKKWGVRSCPNLKNVYYSKSLVVLYDQAFSYNSKLTSAFLRNTALDEMNVGVYMSSAVEYVSLPDTLKSIYATVFENTKVRRVDIPDGVTQIGNRCFAGCAQLEAVYIPASVKKLGEDVFRNSDNVTVYTTQGSAAQKYCSENNVNCVVINEDEIPSKLLGDVNGDKDVNINDVTFMQRELAGYKTDFYPQNCDYDNNCIFDINDATRLQLDLAGFREKV